MKKIVFPTIFLLLIMLILTGCATRPESPSSEKIIAKEDRGIEIIEKFRQEAVSRRVGRWAVVVGISDYKFDQRWDPRKGIPDLEFAHKDAEAFAQFLMTPAGGAFTPDRVLLLTNRKATIREVRKAVGDFLAQSLEDDLVIFFFAGHGTPDPKNPKNLYLLCHDTEPGNYYGTAFPMWEINTAISRTIRSNRVIVLADACHSAGVGGTRSPNTSAQFNAYMEKLAQSKSGVTKITASRADELSQEKRFAGGGHGLFTYYLLDGLKGAADFNRDGFVTLKEAYNHLYDRVRSDSRHSQNPWASAYVSDDIPLGIVDKQVLAAIEARAEAQSKRIQPTPTSAQTYSPSLEVPKDSGLALKLAAAKLAKDEVMVAQKIVDEIIYRNDDAKPDALKYKIDLLLKDNNLKEAEDIEDLLVIPFSEHPSAKKGAEAVYNYYLLQSAGESIEKRIAQLETYISRHPNGLMTEEAEAKLSEIRSGIKNRYERSFKEQLTLAKGFMDQNRFEKSRDALTKAEGITDEALSKYGIHLNRQKIELLQVEVQTKQVQHGHELAFQTAKTEAQKEILEEQIQTWQEFIRTYSGNPYTLEAEKILKTLRPQAETQQQARYDRLLNEAKTALSNRNFAQCLKKLDGALALNIKARDKLGITLNQRDLADVRSRHQTEAQKHQDYLAWQNADSGAKAITRTDTADFDSRIDVYKDFIVKWPNNPYRANAKQAVSDLKQEKINFMGRKFREFFGKARGAFIAKDYTSGYAALEAAKKYANASEMQRADDLARRYNAPPIVQIDLKSDTVDWETPVRFKYAARDKEGDRVQVVKWDFGDGKISQREMPEHTYGKWNSPEKQRSYTVVLEVSDGHSKVKAKKTVMVKRQDCVEKDGRYCKYANGVVKDTQADLEWYAGPNENTNWNEAKRWVESLEVGGGGWRMPTRAELKTLYKKGAGSRNMTPLLETTGWWVWSGEVKDSSSAWGFRFFIGNDDWYARTSSDSLRGFAVRSR